MPDETKPGEQKPGQPETPKGIEDVLKELPKISVSNPTPPSPPKPQTPPPFSPSKPALPEKPLTPNADKFQSFVRTMESDLEAAKKGLKPEPKPFEIKPAPLSSLKASEGTAKPLAPPSGEIKPPLSQLKLGPAEKAKSFETPKPPLPPAAPRPLGGIPGPKKVFPINPRLLIIILVILAAFAGVWFFMTREQEAPVVFTPTPTPVPTPLALSKLIPSKNRITISLTQNFQTALNDEIKKIPVSAGGFTALEIIDENGNEYSKGQIFNKLLTLEYPVGVVATLDPDEWTFVIYGQTEIFNQKGFLVIEAPMIQEKIIGFIAKTDNPDLLRSNLNAWEVSMTEGLKGFFGIDTKKATSEVFLDSIYSGQTVRYRNFPYADKSIDYSVISLSRFNADYFVLTNSRESIYSVIDLFQNQ